MAVDGVKVGFQKSDVDNCGYWFHSSNVNIEMTIKRGMWGRGGLYMCDGGEVMGSILDMLI